MLDRIKPTRSSKTEMWDTLTNAMGLFNKWYKRDSSIKDENCFFNVHASGYDSGSGSEYEFKCEMSAVEDKLPYFENSANCDNGSPLERIYCVPGYDFDEAIQNPGAFHLGNLTVETIWEKGPAIQHQSLPGVGLLKWLGK